MDNPCCACFCGSRSRRRLSTDDPSRQLSSSGSGPSTAIDYDSHHKRKDAIITQPSIQVSRPQPDCTPPYRTPDNQVIKRKFMPAQLTGYPRKARVRIVNEPSYIGGSIAWTGYPIEVQSHASVVIVVKLDEHHDKSTNGEFEGQRLVQYNPEDEYLMVNAGVVEVFPKIIDGNFYTIRKGINQPTALGGFARRRPNQDNGPAVLYNMFKVNTNYIEEEDPYVAPDCLLFKALPPESETHSLYSRAIPVNRFHWTIGRNKGIQGQSNSCYLDTFLFSFFAFSEHLDDVLFCEETFDENSWDTLSVLRYHIVYPLRTFFYVSHDKVEILRGRLVEKTQSNAYRFDQRDIQECMENLFGKILNVKPTLMIGILDGDRTRFYESFCIEIIAETSREIPNFQQLLEHSAVNMSFCVKEASKWFMIQLPRESDHSITAIPSLELDLNNILFKTPKRCYFCNNPAALRFGDRIRDSDITRTFVCRPCALAEGLDISDAVALPSLNGYDPGRPSVAHMCALICIASSHYNCVVRCGRGSEERWAFFDSMSDQDELINPTTQEKVTFNIPLIRYIPNFRRWVNAAQECVNNGENLDRLFNSVQKEEDKDLCKRIFTCPYAILYETCDEEVRRPRRETDI